MAEDGAICAWPDCEKPARRARAGFCNAHYFQNRKVQIGAGHWKGRYSRSPYGPLSALARALDRKVRAEHRDTHRWPSVDELARRVEGVGARRAVILASWELYLSGLWAPAMVPVPRLLRRQAAEAARRRVGTRGGCLCETHVEPANQHEMAQEVRQDVTETAQEPVQESTRKCLKTGSGEVGPPAEPHGNTTE